MFAPAEGWERGIIGGPHPWARRGCRPVRVPASSTKHCRAHSVDNLYIAGSSVFTTGGYANPTFALLAFALRLADTLRSRLGADRAGVVTKPVM